MLYLAFAWDGSLWANGSTPARSIEIGWELAGQPWIAGITSGDLDQDGDLDLIVCDAQTSSVSWIRNDDERFVEEILLTEDVAGPVRTSLADLDGDGDQDVLIAAMGVVIPSYAEVGKVAVLENVDGDFRLRILLENTTRVTDVQVGDFDNDGDLDLSLAQFGYLLGEVAWMENRGDWAFERHVLLEQSGSIHSPIADVDGDGDLDIVSVVSQEWEELYVFVNDGAGRFEKQLIWGSTNEDFGSSGIALSDLDGDGDIDIVYTNGDGFDYALPGPRPWHGVQWFENQGDLAFERHRIGDLPGAYSPAVGDWDGDGVLDIIALSSFNDWERDDAESIVVFKQKGVRQFQRQVVACEPINLLALEAVDLNRDGRCELVTGGFHLFPPWERMSRVRLWSSTARARSE